MAATQKQKIVYWVLTALFLLPMAGSGVPELLFGSPEQTAATMVHLGYPLYLMRMLGLAKILGAVVIVANRWTSLKEWAYAGYFFDLAGAVVSHLIVGDGFFALVPGTLVPLLLGSYFTWKQMREG